MQSDKLIPELEVYANTIAGFMVAQSVAFAFTMGINANFACLIIITELVLSGCLIAHFVASSVLAALALRYLSASITSLSSENQGLIRKLFRAKLIVAVFFAIIPIGVPTAYGTPLFTERTCITKSMKA